MTSPSEYAAREIALDGELARIKFELKERKVNREKRKFELEDMEDRLFEISIKDKQTDLAIAEIHSEGKIRGLEQARKEGRYLEGKFALQQSKWALELATSEIEIAGARQRIDEMRAASQILQQSIDTRFSAMIEGV